MTRGCPLAVVPAEDLGVAEEVLLPLLQAASKEPDSARRLAAARVFTVVLFIA
jgi:hypothetical protein